MGFVVDEDGTEDFLRALRGFIVSIVLSAFKPQPFIYYLRYIFLKINRAIKNGSGIGQINGRHIRNFVNMVKTSPLSSV